MATEAVDSELNCLPKSHHSAGRTASGAVHPDNIALCFKQLGISSLFPPQPILSNVSGFVVKGGITASKWFLTMEGC